MFLAVWAFPFGMYWVAAAEAVLRIGTISSSSVQNGTVTTKGTGGVPVRPTSTASSAPSVGTGGAVGLFERGRGEVWGMLGFVAVGMGAFY